MRDTVDGPWWDCDILLEIYFLAMGCTRRRRHVGVPYLRARETSMCAVEHAHVRAPSPPWLRMDFIPEVLSPAWLPPISVTFFPSVFNYQRLDDLFYYILLHFLQSSLLILVVHETNCALFSFESPFPWFRLENKKLFEARNEEKDLKRRWRKKILLKHEKCDLTSPLTRSWFFPLPPPPPGCCDVEGVERLPHPRLILFFLFIFLLPSAVMWKELGDYLTVDLSLSSSSSFRAWWCGRSWATWARRWRCCRLRGASSPVLTSPPSKPLKVGVLVAVLRYVMTRDTFFGEMWGFMIPFCRRLWGILLTSSINEIFLPPIFSLSSLFPRTCTLSLFLSLSLSFSLFLSLSLSLSPDRERKDALTYLYQDQFYSLGRTGCTPPRAT